jgi:Fe-S-cluster-containing hydrogenase component 2
MSQTQAVAARVPPRGPRLDLLRLLPWLKWLVRRRWFQFALILPNLVFFLLFLNAGLFGTPVGNRNIIIIFVWILWWFLLITVLVPFASRIWCTVCPFPFFGEWYQRRALVRVRAVDPRQGKGGPGVLVGRNRYFGWNRRWPRVLSNIWLQNIGFLGLCTFSALFLTRPLVSVIVLAGIFVLASVLHVVYRQRAFCNYVCPVSGFLSLYSMASTTEVRSVDAEACARCKDKGCLAGNDAGWGCPWFMYPSKMDRNNYCGLCMECIKTCPHDNMTVNLRPPFSDTRLKGYDEAWKAFIMLTLALAYSVIYIGPWGALKDWANIAESRDWTGFLIYASVLWLGALVVIPGLYLLAVWAGRRLAGTELPPARETFLGFVYPLVPLGLLAWVAFSIPLVMVNGSYILTAISDPFGWGWDLFGTALVPWTPVAPHWTPLLQVPLLMVGLFYALKTGYGHALRLFTETRRAVRAFAPVACLLTGFVVLFLKLYVG